MIKSRAVKAMKINKVTIMRQLIYRAKLNSRRIITLDRLLRKYWPW